MKTEQKSLRKCRAVKRPCFSQLPASFRKMEKRDTNKTEMKTAESIIFPYEIWGAIVDLQILWKEEGEAAFR